MATMTCLLALARTKADDPGVCRALLACATLANEIRASSKKGKPAGLVRGCRVPRPSCIGHVDLVDLLAHAGPPRCQLQPRDGTCKLEMGKSMTAPGSNSRSLIGGRPSLGFRGVYLALYPGTRAFLGCLTGGAPLGLQAQFKTSTPASTQLQKISLHPPTSVQSASRSFLAILQNKFKIFGTPRRTRFFARQVPSIKTILELQQHRPRPWIQVKISPSFVPLRPTSVFDRQQFLSPDIHHTSPTTLHRSQP